ncbi:MAG TPA: carboxypeptidase regulatory-like domain-containing protein [Vicinamibacterales bacterium]|nr:carboxypeptidase regulatory-like domain-containing protein [Vicinamibacterales bacterium]
MMTELLFALMFAVAAQQPPPPPPPPPERPPSMQVRDGIASAAKGTAVIKGHVRTVDGRPLRRARIFIRGAGLPNGRTASSGLEGEYEIPDLPAGRFTISAVRGGYLTAEYGQRAFGDDGRPIELADGATLDKIDLTMERAGTVSGRVTDETGEPVSGASVWVHQMQFFHGRRQYVPLTSAQTDDTGLYRIGPVPPGEFVLVAMFRETWTADDKPGEALGYAPTYFPGTASPVEAQRVKVTPAEETTGLDFSLVPGRAASIAGSVIATDGAPLAAASVFVGQEIAGPQFMSMSMIVNGRTAADGTFRLRNIPPGQYQLRASGAAGDRGTETASVTVTLQGTDIEGLVIGADNGALLTGRVVTDAGKRLPAGTLRITPQSAIFERSQITVPPAQDGLVAADGAFTRKVPTGPAFLRASLPTGWMLKQITIGGQDYTDVPFDFRAGQAVGDALVVISDRLPSVSGQASGAKGPATGPVLLIPADAARWREASGALRKARPDASGRYTFDAVRPGTYLLVAVEQMQTWQLFDPEFLEPLREKATKVTVEADPVTVDLRVVR